ncbi:MAG TPA: serine/threonine-protein kinase [Kofleriaceae bacterium]|nr:serine/threonine-protein kinase [Kofleriaceae bacterium]
MADAPERFGSYLVFEQLGQGGMATVHRAELRERGGSTKQVALKRLLPTLQREVVALFLDEARLLRHLHHPNIAETYDSGKVFGTYFIAMEYIKGPTLKELVQHCGATVGAVPQPITLNLAAQLCDALDHAHNRHDEHGKPLGIIHRDITPSNIILSDAGMLKLIDFGLAKAKVSTQETAQGMIKGKFGYVAPEYIGGKLDHRADIWAIGIIMYELLTSRRLFDGPDAFETMMRVKSLPIPRPSLANPRVTPAIDEIVMKALERNTSWRWQSAADMRDAIRQVAADPANHVDAKHVSDWVRWVFTQSPGTEASGVAQLVHLVRPPDAEATVADPRPPAHDEVAPLSRAAMIWYACALALGFVMAAALAWRIAG